MRKYCMVLSFVCACCFVRAQNVGINTPAPHTAVDINGSFAVRESILALVNGDNDISAPADYSFFRITGPTGAFAVTGFGGGSDGRIITLYNSTAQAFTIKNLNNNSAAANQIKTLTGADLVFEASNSSVTLQYDNTESKWLVVASQNQAQVTLTTLGPFGQTGISATGTGSVIIAPAAGLTLIPGLTTNVIIPTGYYAYISSTGGIATSSIVASGFSIVDILLEMDGSLIPTTFRRIYVLNSSGLGTAGLNATANWSISGIVNPTVGVHTFSVYSASPSSFGNNATVSGGSLNVNQGNLCIVLVRQ